MDVLVKPPIKYDSAEWTQATATNYDVSQQALFVNCPKPVKVIVRTDQTITVRFNGTDDTLNPPITVNANTAFELDLDFHEMYITTTTSTAVKVIFLQNL